MPFADDPYAHLPLLNPAQFPNCFVCGANNPHGLHLRVHRDGPDAVARYTPVGHQEGYPGRFHGGLVGLLVDEMLVYAGAVHDLWGMTATVNYRLRRGIGFIETLSLRGSLTRQSSRGYRAAVTIHTPDGSLAAEGSGTCVFLT